MSGGNNHGLRASVRDNPGTITVQYKLDGVDFGGPGTTNARWEAPFDTNFIDRRTDRTS